MIKKRKAAILALLLAAIFLFSAGIVYAQEEEQPDSEELVADFTYSVEGKKVIFESTSTGDITSYIWEFPDGSNSTTQHPIYDFLEENEYYTVNLTVKDSLGNEFKISKIVHTGDSSGSKTMIILGCALAIGIAGIASAIGLALAGSSAIAVTAEKPELFGKLLVLQVLPMTQSVYGLLTAILLMMGAGLLAGMQRLPHLWEWVQSGLVLQ